MTQGSFGTAPTSGKTASAIDATVKQLNLASVCLDKEEFDKTVSPSDRKL